MYPLNFDNWKDRTCANRQFYQVIHVNRNTLDFKSYMTNGRLFDAFEIKCDSNGKKQFRDHSPSFEGDYNIPYETIRKFLKNDSLLTLYEIQKKQFEKRTGEK